MNVIVRVKRIAIIALFLALGVFGVMLVLPYTVPRHDIRAAVTRALATATGVTPQIGATHFSVLPRPSIRFDDVRFAAGDNGLSAGSLVATIRLLPLLLGEVEVSSLTFEQARLNIEFGPDGARLLGLPLKPTVAGANLPDLRIVGGTIDVRTTDARHVERLSDVDASFVWSGASLSTLAAFRWRDMPGTMSLHIADGGALGENARSPVRFRFESDVVRANFEGAFAFQKGLQAEGALSVESKSFRKLLSAFEIEVPTRGGFDTLSLKSRAQITPAALTASGLSIDLDGNRADGTLSLAIDGKRPVLQGTLAADVADFSVYTRGFSLVTEDKRDWSKEALDIKPLSGFDLDLRLSSGKVVLGRTEANRVALAASVKDGKFTLSAGEAQIFGGLLRGTAAIGPSPGEGASVRLAATLQDFDSAQGISTFVGARPVEGLGTFAIAVSGAGNSVSAITRDLSGSAELLVQKGALAGVNVEGALRSMSRKPLSALSELRGGRTPFDRFIAKLAIKGGDAAVDQAQIESDSVTVTLNGSASIPNRDLDLKGIASLVSGSGVALPFMVRGSWDSPKLSPDGPAMLRRSSIERERAL